MNNQALSEIFTHMAEVLEIRGKKSDIFRIRAYEKAALVMKELPNDVSEIIEHEKLEKIPGIGKNIAEKIMDYLQTGKVKQYEEMKKEFPESLIELLEIPFLGPKKLKVLRDTFGVEDKKKLLCVLHSGEVENLPGFGEKTVQNILQGVEIQQAHSARSLLGDVYLLVNEFIDYMKECKAVTKIEPAGSFRRKCETIGDIDLLSTGKDHEKIVEHFVSHPECKKVLAQGSTKGAIILETGKQVDLRVVDENEWGSALQYFTGSKQHNIHLRTISKDNGIKISEYGAFKGDKKIAGNTEESMYKCLGIQYIPPEMREDRGEIDLGIKQAIPNLITTKDINGDLHVHSTYSDGNNTLEEMVYAAQKRGYEYVAISDHSQGLKVANGLDIDRVLKKRDEIEQLRKRVDIVILFGTEVDILADGSLDYPDKVLKGFDFVIGAIHFGFKQDNTKRLLAAMDNPYLHAIAHPTGRKIGFRESTIHDYEAVFKKAARTNTFLEINAQPVRLDMPDQYLHSAKEHGVKFVINTDSHSKNSLWFMELGVSIARRGWLTKEDVVNTYSANNLQKILKKKKV